MVISNSFIEKYRNRKVLIVGMGKSGIAAMEVLVETGADVFVYDEKNIIESNEELYRRVTEICKGHFFGGILPETAGWDYFVMSPGVRPDIPFIQDAIECGTILTGDLELGYEANISSFVAITGTNGKTTTTSLVGEIFKAANIDSEVTGNIGRPIIESTCAERKTGGKIFITEISSFQLETIDRFNPHIAAFLNLASDHLDRHGNIENYGVTKARIFENQTDEDYLIYNYDDKPVCELVKKAKSTLVPFSRREELFDGVYAKDGKIYINCNGKTEELLDTSDLKIPGSHNLENALAAIAISNKAGIDSKIIVNVLREFTGVVHRMEFVDVIDGVRYVNDSKGTNTDASLKAIEATETDIILIAGGYDKGETFDDFINHFDGKVKCMVLLGATAKKIYDTAMKLGFNNAILCSDMDDCVRRAKSEAAPGDTVLLSPACASWGMYESYIERGNHFKKLVNDLRELE